MPSFFASVVTVSPSTSMTAGSDNGHAHVAVATVDLDDVADGDLLLAAAAADDRVHRGPPLVRKFGRAAGPKNGRTEVGASRTDGQGYGSGRVGVKPSRAVRRDQRLLDLLGLSTSVRLPDAVLAVGDDGVEQPIGGRALGALRQGVSATGWATSAEPVSATPPEERR